MKKYIRVITLSLLISFAFVNAATARGQLEQKSCGSCNKSSPLGLYVGGVIGEQKNAYSMLESDHIQLSTQVDRIFGLKQRSLTGGAVLGYGVQWMRVYWGIEAEALFGNNKANSTLFANSANLSNVNARMKSGTSYGGALQIGTNLFGALIYTRWGIEWRTFHASLFNQDFTNAYPESQINAKKRQVAFVPGIGIDYPIINGFNLRFEAREAFYDGKTVRSADNITNQAKLSWRKTTVSTLLLGFVYRTGLGEFKR